MPTVSKKDINGGSPSRTATTIPESAYWVSDH